MEYKALVQKLFRFRVLSQMWPSECTICFLVQKFNQVVSFLLSHRSYDRELSGIGFESQYDHLHDQVGLL